MSAVPSADPAVCSKDDAFSLGTTGVVLTCLISRLYEKGR
jgi:hypothetical protein